jgi:hypothetical protein
MNKIQSACSACRWTFLLLAGTAVLPVPVRAIDIDFESGYLSVGGINANGSLTGQPSTSGATKWTASDQAPANDTYRIAPDTITGSGQMLASTSSSNAATFYTFTPGDGDLGGTFNSVSSVINFSLQFAFNTTAAYTNRGSDQMALGRISFGPTLAPILTIELVSSGELDFSDGPDTCVVTSTPTNASTGFGGGFVAKKNVNVTISGAIDYAKGTYTLSVNGVQQRTAKNATNLAFRNPAGADGDAINLRELNGGSPSYIPTSFDNISLTLRSGAAK